MRSTPCLQVFNRHWLRLEIPPVLFLSYMFRHVLVGYAIHDIVVESLVLGYHLIDSTPVGQSSNVAVVDKNIGLYLS